MGKLMPIALFVKLLTEAEGRHDGYIMGATGQNPKKWDAGSWWFSQYSGEQREKALYWRVHARRVWDCNGLAEGLYREYSGTDINTKARYNYSTWCGIKGKGVIPPDMRVPGAAVFIHSKSAGYITHVGYLEKPVDKSKPTGDWYVIEARGVMYGVVRTKLSRRGWNRWGYMTKFFDYSDQNESAPTLTLGDRLLTNGTEGADVAELQTNLVYLGYSCGGCGIDGDFGDATELAVRAFQKDNQLDVDGEFGALSHKKMRELISGDYSARPDKVAIVGGSCWVRNKPGTDGAKIGIAKENSHFAYKGETTEDGWLLIEYAGNSGWVSGKYGRLVV